MTIRALQKVGGAYKGTIKVGDAYKGTTKGG